MTDQGDSAASKKGFAARFSKGTSFVQRRMQEDSGGGFAARFSEKAGRAAAFSEAKSIPRSSKAADGGFAKAAKRSRLDCLFLVRGKDKGRSAWHYVLVDKNKREMFLAKSRSGSMDVALYGEILYSGWGDDPPEDIVKKVEEEFGA